MPVMAILNMIHLHNQIPPKAAIQIIVNSLLPVPSTRQFGFPEVTASPASNSRNSPLTPLTRLPAGRSSMSIWVVPKIMGPFLVIDYITAPNIQRYQNGTHILGTTHINSNGAASVRVRVSARQMSRGLPLLLNCATVSSSNNSSNRSISSNVLTRKRI